MSLRLVPHLNPFRLLLACLLLALAPLAAQQSRPTTAPAAHRVLHPALHSAQPASYRISINFRRCRHGRPCAERTYMLLATVGESLPALRDDLYYRTDADCKTSDCTVEGATDLDVLALKAHGKLVTLALKFSLHTMGNDVPDFLPKLPMYGTHQYLVTPTVAVGKRALIYAANDPSNKNLTEVQLLIELFDPENPGPLSALSPSENR
jgi:hypothetical protein